MTEDRRRVNDLIGGRKTLDPVAAVLRIDHKDLLTHRNVGKNFDRIAEIKNFLARCDRRPVRCATAPSRRAR